MNNETFRILAKHFGEAEHVTVDFESGACPATNGSRIVLPDDLQAGGDIMLAALLHECGHIAHTQFEATESIEDKALFNALNSLEDVRVDELTAAKYPTARDFSRASLAALLERNAERLKGEPVAVQILKGIVMLAIDPTLELAAVYPETAARAEALAAEYIPKALACKSTLELIPVARDLLAAILGRMTPEEMTKKPSQQGQQGQGTPQQGTGEATEGEAGQSAAEAVSKAGKARQEASKAQAAKDQARQAYDASRESERADYEAYKKARTQRRANETKAARAAIDARRNGRDPETDAATKAAKAKADQWRAKEQAHADRVNAHRKSREALEKAYYEADRATGQAGQAAAEAEAQARQAIDGLFSCEAGHDIAVTGFGAVDVDALRQLKPVTVASDLGETIREALTIKRDQNKADETGNQINARQLPEYQTADPETFFIDQERREYQTRVAVLVDSSGSMGDIGRQGRADMAVNALAALMDAAKKAIHSGAPAELAVYAFGDAPAVVYSEVDQYTGRENLARDWERARRATGSGTSILEAVNKASADLKEHADAERVLIIVTDADIDDSDAKTLRNQTVTDGARVVFIGVQAQLEGKHRKDARHLFARYNITSEQNAGDILRRAFLDAIA